MSIDKSSWTLVDLVRNQAARLGEREFISFEQGARLTFAGFDRESDAAALRLAALGVGPGDRVLALVKNRVELLLTMFATFKLGAIYVPINTELKGAFLEHQLRNAEPKVVLVDTDLADAFHGVDAGDGDIVAVVFIAGGIPDQVPPVFSTARQLSYEDFSALAAADAGVLVTPKPEDIAFIMYTSGTTGPSKGVLMPHAHCYLFGLGTQRALELAEADRYYICMPLFHANGLLMQFLGSFIAGAWVYVVERFSPNRWLDDVRASQATVTNALGVMPEFIFRHPESPLDSDNNLRVVMAAPVADEWSTDFERRYDVSIRQGFGMTECNIPAYTGPDDPLEVGCAGQVLDEFFEVRIGHMDTDEPLPADEIGEILVRPKEPSCFMAGYFKMPEKTVEAWRNLWFHTGDAGRFDASGRLYFVDRIKDCIRRRGENISSFEVEQVLNNHPAIAESAVVGIRVDGAGGEEEVKALLILAPGQEIENAALLDYCAEHMPRFAVPRYLEWINDLSKTATGKIQKQSLRDDGLTDGTWDRETIGYKIARR
ncbi:MAG: AMP-binding protein [Rhodospirillaceae bacterium]|jgi:crotonobetaine/carnitine-CoA ligase|nr:AMP-binding protein [Rhodospirillaceae bacterium]MBT3490929.1 AMP-binding protein [Rhodospirillaceae bacterium]MBT3780945.1 AMP-binding protein [Rhodospirillaceae bacterium]MBT3978341.1 AMP-binding protein [Rhodospirillaceae bacterium]MBT4170577.1 AMP-binding protein [Rhodospirillaceae bacterium]